MRTNALGKVPRLFVRIRFHFLSVVTCHSQHEQVTNDK